jgi:6-phosphogluconolactonase/glucosamine-6-phosphate isomerase/deaminase
MINFIKCKDSSVGEKELAGRLIKHIEADKRTVWTLPGGSNIPISAKVLKNIRDSVEMGKLRNLVIMQCDERFGPPGHSDSNWRQLKDLNFPVEGIENYPILYGKTLEETAKDYSKIVEKQFKQADIIIGQFGIGTDAHIAGLMPDCIGFESNRPVVGYEHPTFTRISLTPKWLLMINEAFMFAFGPSKKDAIEKTREGTSPIKKVPANILYQIDAVNFYTDQI